MEPTYIYRADVLDVHDGDTYRARVDLGFHCAVTIQVRLHGVDTPELGALPGGEARLFVVRTIAAQPIVVRSYKDQRSFERWVCDVGLFDGRDLGDVIVAAGHGRRI